jgi:hypothetical protein
VGKANGSRECASGGVPTIQREGVRFKNGGHAPRAPLATLRSIAGLPMMLDRSAKMKPCAKARGAARDKLSRRNPFHQQLRVLNSTA